MFRLKSGEDIRADLKGGRHISARLVVFVQTISDIRASLIGLQAFKKRARESIAGEPSSGAWQPSSSFNVQRPPVAP